MRALYLLIIMLLVSSGCKNETSGVIAKQDLPKDFKYLNLIWNRSEKVIPDPYYGCVRPIADSILAKYNYGKIFPTDESFRDSDLASLVDSIQLAVKNKNIEFILSHLSDTVFMGYSADVPETADGFRQYWMDENGIVSDELWVEMERALKLGGKFLALEKDYPFYGHKIYQIPYLLFPWEISDMFMSQAAIAENVPVYEKKDSTSNVVGYLNYDIVDVNYEESGVEPLFEGVTTITVNQMDWVKINTLDMKISGYVDGKFLYAPLGLRLFLAKNSGKWKIRGIAIGE